MSAWPTYVHLHTMDLENIFENVGEKQAGQIDRTRLFHQITWLGDPR